MHARRFSCPGSLDVCPPLYTDQLAVTSAFMGNEWSDEVEAVEEIEEIKVTVLPEGDEILYIPPSLLTTTLKSKTSLLSRFKFVLTTVFTYHNMNV